MVKTATLVILGIVSLGMAFVPRAAAQCAFPGLNATTAGPSQAFESEARVAPASVTENSEAQGSRGRIMGFWKVKFVSERTPGIPDGTVVDNGFAQWHSDGTEIMNSSRAPATGSFCLGVYEKSGPSSYDLNHFALSFDPAGNFVGPAQIREQVTLDRKADRYDGTFTIDQYDASGNPIAHITGKVHGTRISVDTPIADVL
jgi:hypothetical protein